MYFGGFYDHFSWDKSKRFSVERYKKVSLYGKNHKAEQLPISERYWTLGIFHNRNPLNLDSDLDSLD